MTDHYSSLSSSLSQESIPESSQSLKVMPEGKAGTTPGSTITTAVTPSLVLPQVTVLGHETYKVHRSEKSTQS